MLQTIFASSGPLTGMMCIDLLGDARPPLKTKCYTFVTELVGIKLHDGENTFRQCTGSVVEIYSTI